MGNEYVLAFMDSDILSNICLTDYAPTRTLFDSMNITSLDRSGYNFNMFSVKATPL